MATYLVTDLDGDWYADDFKTAAFMANDSERRGQYVQIYELTAGKPKLVYHTEGGLVNGKKTKI